MKEKNTSKEMKKKEMSKEKKIKKKRTTKEKEKNKKKKLLKIAVCSYYLLLDPIQHVKKIPTLEPHIDADVAPHPGGSLTDWLRREPESGFISDITDAALAGGEPAQTGASLQRLLRSCPQLTSPLFRTAAASASP